MSFTKQPYAGDSNGENVLLVMKKTPVGKTLFDSKVNMSTQIMSLRVEILMLLLLNWFRSKQTDHMLRMSRMLLLRL